MLRLRMAPEPCDWQLECTELKQRGAHLLQSGLWWDCSFLVGSEPHQVIVPGHKLILAMASPVFEAMFYGGVTEKNEQIPISDVQPEAFKALLDYIYTDNINIGSFDKACELYYGAKKYMLPHLVTECTQYLLADLNPKNACRAYEFARLFEENNLMKTCLQIISSNTKEVLSDSSFEDVELDTVVTVFSLEHLDVDSELQLCEALVRHAQAQAARQPESGPGSPAPAASVEVLDDVWGCPAGTACVRSFSPTSPEAGDAEPRRAEPELSGPDARPESREKPTIRSAIEKIRFLTLTPRQFAEGPASARPPLLADSELLTVLKHLLSSNPDEPLPRGLSACREPRDPKARAEATFRFTVTDFRNLKHPVWSPPCYVRNLPWKIKVRPHHREHQKFLACFLYCNRENKSYSCSRNAEYAFRLISHKPGSKPYIRPSDERLLSSEKFGFGYPDFIAWNDVLDPEKGYIKDGAITLEAHVVAAPGPD